MNRVELEAEIEVLQHIIKDTDKAIELTEANLEWFEKQEVELRLRSASAQERINEIEEILEEEELIEILKKAESLYDASKE